MTSRHWGRENRPENRFCLFKIDVFFDIFAGQVRDRLDHMATAGELFLEDDLQGKNREGTNKRLFHLDRIVVPVFDCFGWVLQIQISTDCEMTWSSFDSHDANVKKKVLQEAYCPEGLQPQSTRPSQRSYDDPTDVIKWIEFVIFSENWDQYPKISWDFPMGPLEFCDL